MNHNDHERGWLLPEGCKDLMDVLRLREGGKEMPELPPVVGEIELPDRIELCELARLVNQKPFQLIVDLTALGVFAQLDQPLDFSVAAKLARNYGYRSVHGRS
jgi:hypothetical protein